MSTAVVAARADDTPLSVLKMFPSGEALTVADRPAFILLPDKSIQQTPQPWIFYAPALPAYPDEHEKRMHQTFLEDGVAVAGIDVGEAYGSPRGRELFTAFYDELVTRRGFASKPCLLGRSRGGLWVMSWACDHPDRVAGIAGIYPAFDLRTHPGLEKAAPAYDLTPQALEAQLDKHNPIARASILAKARVPVFIIHGWDDKVVPLLPNSGALRAAYGPNNRLTLLAFNDRGHDFWEGYFYCEELLEFAIARAKAGARAEK